MRAQSRWPVATGGQRRTGAASPRLRQSVVQPSSVDPRAPVARPETSFAIGGERGIGLRLSAGPTGRHGRRRDELRQRRGEPLQRPEQDIGEDEIERRAAANAGRGERRSPARRVTTAPARLSRALSRATRTACAVDIGRQHAAAQRARRGDGEHAGAGAEVENASRPCRRLAHPVQREQAAARRAVMAGAEGERRLDLDADPVDGTSARSCAPCTTKRPAVDRLKPGEAFGDPILGRDAFELRTFAARPGRRRQSPHALSSGTSRK